MGHAAQTHAESAMLPGGGVGSIGRLAKVSKEEMRSMQVVTIWLRPRWVEATAPSGSGCDPKSVAGGEMGFHRRPGRGCR